MSSLLGITYTLAAAEAEKAFHTSMEKMMIDWSIFFILVLVLLAFGASILAFGLNKEKLLKALKGGSPEANQTSKSPEA